MCGALRLVQEPRERDEVAKTIGERAAEISKA